jgi:hypothetical protein
MVSVVRGAVKIPVNASRNSSSMEAVRDQCRSTMSKIFLLNSAASSRCAPTELSAHPFSCVLASTFDGVPRSSAAILNRRARNRWTRPEDARPEAVGARC